LVVFSEDYTATNFFDFITVNCDMKDLIEETSSGLPQWSAIRIYAISVKRGHYIRVAYCRKYTHLSFMGGRYSRPAFVSKRRQVGPHSLNIARRELELIKISNFTRLVTRTKNISVPGGKDIN